MWVIGADMHFCPTKAANVENVDLNFPCSTKQHQQQPKLGGVRAIYQAFGMNDGWGGPGGRVANSLTGPDQQLERHAESKMRGQEHWKGGDREMKRERKKAPSKKSGWSITHIHPSLSLFFCQFFKGPKKTSWLNAQNLQEGMSRGYNLHAALYCQYKFMLWFIFIWFSSGFWMLCEYSKL